MGEIEILGNGAYLPEKMIDNSYLANELNVTTQFILGRTGINTRYFAQSETIEELAVCAALRLFSSVNIPKEEVGIIVAATTSTNRLMPGVSFEVQKSLKIKNCFCFDILAGCSGYVNALDLVRNYLIVGKAKYGLVIGVDILSKHTKEDISTRILLGDGAGATLIGRTEKKKKYASLIESNGEEGDILTYSFGENIKMNGKEVYKYAVTKTIQNIKDLLKKENMTLEEIDYLVMHQSNLRIMNSICEKLKIPKEKMYVNIEKVGNTFCASIPIALTHMQEEGKLKKGNKIILLGYGGGLNTASILLEI